MSVTRALPAFEVMMGDMPIRQPLPTQSVDKVDPFLLLHHHTAEIPSGTDRWNAGVGPHPHRGFSPVTFIYQGGVHHRDSRGNNSVVGAGGVQWMDVGLGIIHSERPPAQLCEEGGTQEIIQIWINSPADKKMLEPNYYPFQQEELTSVPEHPELGITSGEPIPGASAGPLKGVYPIQSFHGKTSVSALTFNVREGEQGLFYLLDGGGTLSGYGLVEGLVMYQLTPGTYTFKPSEPTKVLFVSAEPILEKVESYGPFVMNNQTEIMEAMRDYQMGKMGYLVERDMD